MVKFISPLTFYYAALSLTESIYSLKFRHVIFVTIISIFLFSLSFLPWPESLRSFFVEHASFVLYWIVLGILSSVGVGSGFHTFILYLAPHVLRVAGTAIRLRSVDFSAQIDTYFSIPTVYDIESIVESLEPRYASNAWTLSSIKTLTSSASDASDTITSLDVSIFEIYKKVAWPCFLWGLGTAIGELPPYFMARASSASGNSLAEITNVLTLKKQITDNNNMLSTISQEKETDRIKVKEKTRKRSKSSSSSSSSSLSIVNEHAIAHSQLTSIQRMQVIVYDLIQRYGFFAVLVAASVPNPLFDLAGITCGHFQVPFLTFFGATMIGKSLIKVTLQCIFLILAAKKGESFLKTLVGDDADASIEKLLEQSLPSKSSSIETKGSLTTVVSIIKSAWKGFLGGMIVFFLLSIISSIGDEYYQRRVVAKLDEEKNELSETNKKNKITTKTRKTVVHISKDKLARKRRGSVRKQ
jgi:vacuole membrane protein 1